MSADPLPPVPVDEYLHSMWQPDQEYVDGALVGRAVPDEPHAAMEEIVAGHLRKYRKEFTYAVLTECRVEVAPGSRYRVGDVVVCNMPVPWTLVLQSVPIAVIEIWSPEDRLEHQMSRFADFHNRGVRQIIVLDPRAAASLRYEAGTLRRTAVNSIDLPDNREIPFPAAELLAEVRRQLG